MSNERIIERRIEVQPKPNEIATCFAALHSDEMVTFFNRVAFIVSEWGDGRLSMQLQHVSDDEKLTDRARFLMEKIGEYAQRID